MESVGWQTVAVVYVAADVLTSAHHMQLLGWVFFCAV
jgi:hypothetical protein